MDAVFGVLRQQYRVVEVRSRSSLLDGRLSKILRGKVTVVNIFSSTSVVGLLRRSTDRLFDSSSALQSRAYHHSCTSLWHRLYLALSSTFKPLSHRHTTMSLTTAFLPTTLDPNATVDDGCGTWDELWLTCFDDFSIEIIVEVLVFGYCFVGLAIVCDDYLVQSLETLCARWNVREDVAGASFVAFGSAAPEIIINSITTIKSAGSDTGAGADLGVSAIIGSGMIAFLLIPGCCGVFSSKVLPLKRRPLLRDSLTYLAALIILCVFMSNGTVELYEGLVLTGMVASSASVPFC